MADYPFELIDLKDEPRVDRAGRVIAEKKARFFLGDFGPFVERFPAETFTDAVLMERVDALRRTLGNLQR